MYFLLSLLCMMEQPFLHIVSFLPVHQQLAFGIGDKFTLRASGRRNSLADAIIKVYVLSHTYAAFLQSVSSCDR